MRRSSPTSRPSSGYATSAEETAERLGRCSTPVEHAALVADEDGRAVGWIHVALVTSLVSGLRRTSADWWSTRASRSSGIGAELLAAAETWAREHGATRMVVRSRMARERAHRFYEREGYALVKTSHVFEKRLV